VGFHEAAIPSVPRSVSPACGNTRGERNATFSLLMAREQKVRRLCMRSSSAYGDTEPPSVRMRHPLHRTRRQVVGEYIGRFFSVALGYETSLCATLMSLDTSGIRSQYSIISRFIRFAVERKTANNFTDDGKNSLRFYLHLKCGGRESQGAEV